MIEILVIIALAAIFIFFSNQFRKGSFHECSSCKEQKLGRDGIFWSMTGIGSDNMFTCDDCCKKLLHEE